ncbi:MAG: 2-oxoglutarate and iron-dependent oxygenase domain-containing protein [Granulosicoccaceae bacterium]
MSYAKAEELDSKLIPVIDVSAFGTDDEQSQKIANALHAASQSLGFIYIKGHGIPTATIDNARSSAYNFFRQTPELKASQKISEQHRGWLAQGGSKMQDNAKSDLKESFIWGFQDNAGQSPQDHPLRGANQWPTQLMQFEQHSMAYFTQAHRVAETLLQGFALGLGLNKGFFLSSTDKPLSRASYVYYPAQDVSLGEDQFGVGPHTDFGVLTVLGQDDVGGLQVQDASGRWIQAPPIVDTLIVNVADLLSRWTAGAYKSTPHRVVNSSGRERLSLVLAYDPNPDTIIDSTQIPTLDNSHAEEPITCGEYLIWRFNKAFAYRNF